MGRVGSQKPRTRRSPSQVFHTYIAHQLGLSKVPLDRLPSSHESHDRSSASEHIIGGETSSGGKLWQSARMVRQHRESDSSKSTTFLRITIHTRFWEALYA